MIRGFRHTLVTAGSLAAMLGGRPAVVRAQATAAPLTARLTGRVVDRASRAGVARAEIVLVGDGRSVRTDSAGDYELAGLPAGSVRLLVRALAYQPMPLVVELGPGEQRERTIALDSIGAGAEDAAPELPGVTVEARAPTTSYRLADFERRRRTGRGQYLVEADIRRLGASRLSDALRGLRGITLMCRGNGCRVMMSRASNCEPEYVVDGRVDNMFGPTTPIRDVVALEVYTGASDVPGEFAGARAGCGVIGIWTRTGPVAREP